MRQIRIAAVVVLFVGGIIGSGLVGSGLGLAQQKDAATSAQITGLLVDARCYVKNGSTGEDHQECAVQCLKDGSPAALLVNGEMFYVLVPSMGLVPYVNHTVRLTGRVDPKAHAVIPTKLEVKKGETWIEGQVPKTMM